MFAIPTWVGATFSNVTLIVTSSQSSRVIHSAAPFLLIVGILFQHEDSRAPPPPSAPPLLTADGVVNFHVAFDQSAPYCWTEELPSTCSPFTLSEHLLKKLFLKRSNICKANFTLLFRKHRPNGTSRMVSMDVFFCGWL